MFIYVMVCCVALLLSVNFNRRLEEILPIAFSAMALGMFFFSRVLSLTQSVLALLIFTIVSCLVMLWLAIFKRKKLSGKIKDCCLTPGVLGFFIIFSFFILFDQGRGLVHSDDLTFWGYGVRFMYEYGTMYERNAGYPPVPFLWEYLANKTWIGYSEGISMSALAIWSASMLLPLYRKVLRISSARWWIVSGFILLIPISLSAEAYDTLVPDFLLSTTVAYTALYMYRFCIEPSRFHFISIIVGLLTCAFTKRTGIVFSALLIMAFLILLEQVNQLNGKRLCQIGIGSGVISLIYSMWPGSGKYTLLPIGMFAAGSIFARIWKYRVEEKCSERASIIFNKMRTMFLLTIGLLFFLVSYWYSNTENGRVICNFLKNVFSTNYSSIGSVVRFSLFAFLMSTWILMEVWKYLRVKRENRNDAAFYKLYSTVFIIELLCLCYLVILGYLYVTTIAPANEGFGVYIPSFERYVLPCYYSILVIVLDYVISFEQNRIFTLGMTLVLLLITSPDLLCSYMYNKIEQYPFYGFEKAGITLTSEDKIYFVDEANDGEGVRTGFAFEYACMPAECSVENELYGTQKEPLQKRISQDEWEEILADGYNYVYLQTLDNAFRDDYAELFGTDLIETGKVYTVINQGGRIRLKVQ